MAVRGTIFDIQHFCTHDGPGVRTVVFLKGCRLRCRWCHNPESQLPELELFFHPMKCIACGKCTEVCPQHRPHEILSDSTLRKQYCRGCLLCADVCMSGAIEKIGNQTDVDTVMKEVLADVQYFRHSGGGMTLSGGEPLMQPAFSLALLQSARSYNIHTAVETSGYGKREDLQAMLPFIDLFLWDIKMTKSELHRKYTGVSFLPILNNLRYAADNGANIVLRILYIPKLHDNVIYIKTLSEIMSSLNCKPELEIIPIHRFGVAKLQKLGLKEEYVFREPTPEQINCFKSKIRIR